MGTTWALARLVSLCTMLMLLLVFAWTIPHELALFYIFYIVQVISLLAAFQKKTGTGLDAKLLKQRQKVIEMEMCQKRKEEESRVWTGGERCFTE